MAVTIQRTLGYKDLYGKPICFYKTILGRRIGRTAIFQFSALMLTYCRRGIVVPFNDLVAMFYSYGGTFDQKGLDDVLQRVAKLPNYGKQFTYGILSEESLLHLYIWAAKNKIIFEAGNGKEDLNSPYFLKLMLLFNDDVLQRYDKALLSVRKYPDRHLLRNILAERFGQNDIVDIDYGKLIFAQTYKLMELLNFLESTPKYNALYNHLLTDFKTTTKEGFFKALGGAVITPLNVNKTGINYLVVKNDQQSKDNIEFLDKLAHSAAEAEQGPTDYRFLRDRPLQKAGNEYRIVFDLFLIKKMYNGIIFKLSAYHKIDPTLFNGQVFGALRDEFTEAVLLYNTFSAVVDKSHTIKITGNDFKAANLKREPDYYCRHNNRILLSESKDFFMTAEEKLSYNYDTIIGGLSKDGRLKKATLQLATNVGRILQNKLPLDPGQGPNATILPVIVLHDSLYDAPALNYWTNEWFQEELNNLKGKHEFNGINFSNVRPVTIVDIDTLILYRTNFEKGQLNLFDMIEEYQNYVDFPGVTDQNFQKGIMPFAVFADNYAASKGVVVDLKLIADTYNLSGFVDQV